MATSEVPPELYYEILKYYSVKQQEITFLWTTARQVSRHFKSAIERVFEERHLPRTYLEIRDVYESFVSESFEFSHIDENNLALAVFMVKECTDRARAKMVRRIKSAFEHGDGPHGYIFHEPQIHVHVRREVNDIPLLGFEPDWDNLVIRFDWKQTFSAFFREDKEFHRRVHVWVEAQKADILEMRVKIDRGELDEMAMFSRMLDSFGGSYDKAHEEVRFDRICKNIWDSSGKKWTRELHGSDDDPDLAYKALKEARVIAGFEKYSDEEDEGGDDEEEASQDDDEGDWSDTSEEE